MERWVMEIKVNGQWIAVKASHATEPYIYATQAEAQHMLEMCYPDQCREDRLDSTHKRCRVRELP